MKVRCIYDTGASLSQKFLDNGYHKELEMNLELNKEYLIYGISFYNDICEYLISDKYNKIFWFPDEIFHVSENSISSLWYFKKLEKTEWLTSNWYIWGYYELANYEKHLEDLIERVPEALEIFYIRKKNMDLEFSDLSIKEKASTVDNNWLMCPTCVDAWESNSIFAMVECPKCKNVMHNPKYYKDR